MRLTSIPRSIYVVALILALGVIFKILSAAPTWMHYDENYYLNIGQNYLLRGELTPYMWRLDTDTNIIAGSGTGYGIFLLVGWMKLVGLSLFGGRLLMILLGLCSAGVMYFVAYKWWQSRVAGVVALVFGVISTSPFYSFVMRMDSPGMLAYSIVLLLHISAVRSRSRGLYFATGVGSVVAVEFHILGILYIVALTAWHLIEYAQELIQKRRLVFYTGPAYFGVGGLIAGILYILVHIAPDPAAYFLIPANYSHPLVVLKEVERYQRFMILRPVEFLLLFFSLYTALRRHRREDMHFVMLIGTWMAALYVAGFSPSTHYTYHIWPLLAIGTAGFFARGLATERQQLRPRLYFGVVLAVVTLLLNFGMHLSNREPFELRYPVDIPANLAFVREAVPQDAVVMGKVTDYYYLMDYPNFMTYRDTDEYGAAARGETQLEFWRRIQPQVIVVDERAEDAELDQYMNELQFEEVGPDVWVAAQLRDQLGGL